jgi:hypothetical protein
MEYERLSQQGNRSSSFLNVLVKSVYKISRSVGAVPGTTVCYVNQWVVKYDGTKYVTEVTDGRSQWPRSLRRGSATARLLGLWVRIPPGHGCLSVLSVVCCQLEVSATT